MRSEATTPTLAVIQGEAAGNAMRIAYLAWAKNRSEWGGLAWGRPYTRRNGTRAVWIAAMTPGQGTASAVSFEMAPSSYVVGLKMLRAAGYPSDLQELGMWHSHPGYGAFLSSVDEDYFRLVYPTPSMVSIVIDPINNENRVFAKNRQGIEVVPNFLYAGSQLGRLGELDGRAAFEAVYGRLQ